jgi:hypothetical protein
MAPVLERVSPDGRLVADQLSGAFPPVAANVVLYAVFVTPPGKELVVIVNAAAMVNESCLVAVWGVGMAESVAVTVTVKGPLTVGVPEIVPFELMVRPDGRLVAIQLMGAVPPEKPNDVLYPTPITPLGKDVVVIVKAATTVKESCLVASWAVGMVASETDKLTGKVPLAWGVPEMFPEDELMLMPGGSPEALQLRGEFPPETPTVELYAKPTAPVGKEVLVIAKVGAIVNDNGLLAVCGVREVESVAVTVTE